MDVMSAALQEYRQRYQQARARLWAGKQVSAPHVIYELPIGPRRPVFAGDLVLATPTDLARRIVRDIVRKHGVSAEDLGSERKTAAIVRARQEACWRLRREMSWTWTRLGQFLGGLDRVTVIRSATRHQDMLDAEAGR